MLLFVTAAGGFELDIRDGTGTVQGQVLVSASGLSQNTNHNIAFTYDVTIANGVKLFLDGVQIGSTSTNDAFNPRAVGSSISIGSRVNGTFQSNGVFDECLIYQDVLTPGEIKFLHNYQKALGLERSYFSALELLIPEFDPEVIKGTDFYTYVLEALEVIS